MGLYDDYFPNGGGFGSSTDLDAPAYSAPSYPGLIPSFTGGGSAPASPAVPATLGNIGDVVKRAPIMDFDEYRRSVGGLGGILRGLASGGPLGAITEGFGLNDHRADYMRYLAAALGVSDAAQTNALGAMKVSGYQRMQDQLNGSAPTRPGVMSGAMAPPAGAPSSGPAVPPITATPAAASPVPASLGGAPAAAPPIAAPVTGTPPASAPAPAGQPRPLFNVAALRQQYLIAAATPGMEQLAATLQTALAKGVPDGAYLGEDGGIYARPGANAFVEGQERSKKLGQELMTTDASGRVVNLPGAVAAAAGKAGAVKRAEEQATVGPTNSKVRFATDEEIRKAGPVANAQLPAKIVENAAKPLETRPGNEVRFPLGVPSFGTDGKFTFAPQTDAMRNSLEPGKREEAAAAAASDANKLAAGAPQSIARIEQTADAAKNADFGSLTGIGNFLSKAGYATNFAPGEAASANAIVDKMTTLLAGDTTSALGQTANAALQTLKENLPNRGMTKDAFAEMLGTLLGVQKHAQAVADLRNGAKTNVGIESTPEFKALTQDKFIREGVDETRRRMGLPPLPSPVLPNAEEAHLAALKAAAEAEQKRRALFSNGMPQP